jgi:hypothetical protein
MGDDMHDDGLVHGHDWAREKPNVTAFLYRPADPGPDIAAAMSTKQDEWHDDGLVHGHGWARSG